MSAFIFYYYKGKLHFYNDSDDISELNVDVYIKAFKRK